MPWLLSLVLIGLTAAFAQAQDEEDPLVQMVVDLLNDPDHDMRALGFDQVREEAPGEAATKKFGELLPTLPAETQVGLLEALGDRKDQAARPAIMARLEKSEDEAVRAAAIRAIGALGTANDVPLLAKKVGSDAEKEKTAARESLVRLRGDGVDKAILAELEKGEPAVRAELLGVLASRNAKDSVPTVLASTSDSDPSVRVAALEALRYLADADDLPGMIDALKAADNFVENRKAELAILAVCSRQGEACADALIAGLEGADAVSRITLLTAIARAGGPKALDAIVAALQDKDEAVADEAVRLLAGWPDAAAAEHLIEIAKTSESERRQVIALRGLVCLGSARGARPGDVALLSEAMNLAKRTQEKRLVLGALGGIGSPEALELALPWLSLATLQNDAGLAVVLIAEKIEDGHKEAARDAVQSVLRRVRDESIRKRAQAVLETL